MVRTKRSAWAFKFGEWGGSFTDCTPVLFRISTNSVVNKGSRLAGSGTPDSLNSLSAGRVTQVSKKCKIPVKTAYMQTGNSDVRTGGQSAFFSDRRSVVKLGVTLPAMDYFTASSGSRNILRIPFGSSQLKQPRCTRAHDLTSCHECLDRVGNRDECVPARPFRKSRSHWNRRCSLVMALPPGGRPYSAPYELNTGALPIK